MLLKSLNNLIPRKALLTIYKSFIRPYLDYGDVVSDQSNNESLYQTIESVQYKAVLALTRCNKRNISSKML